MPFPATWMDLKIIILNEDIERQMPIDIYTMKYYSAIKKNEIIPFAGTWMDLEIIILSKVSQKEKDKYHMKSLICGI